MKNVGLVFAIAGVLAAQTPSAPQWFPASPYAGEWQVSFTEKQDEGIKLTVQSEPEGAEVFLEDLKIGVTPVKNFIRPTGPLKIRVVRAGYLPSALLLNALNKGDYTLSVRLEPAWASLEVDGLTPETILLVNDETVQIFRTIRLAPGANKLVFRRFGFTDVVHNFRAEPLAKYQIKLEWKPAPFEITAKEPLRSLINPNLPGNLGSFSWPFEVTAPGKANLGIYREGSEEEIASIDLPPFTTWEQRVEYRPSPHLPEGTYRAQLRARAQDGLEYKVETQFQIDTSLRFSPGFTWLEPSFLPPQTLSFQTNLGLYLKPGTPFELSMDLRLPFGDWEPQLKLGVRTGEQLSNLYAGLRLLGPALYSISGFKVFWGLESGQNFSNLQANGLFSGQPNGLAMLLGLKFWSEFGPFLIALGRAGVLFVDLTPYLSPRLSLGWAVPSLQLGLGAEYHSAKVSNWEVALWLNTLVPHTNLILGLDALASFSTIQEVLWLLSLTLGIVP